MTDTTTQALAFQLKGSLLTLTVLEVLNPDINAIQHQLLSLVKQTPDLFKRMPVIIDLNKISALTENFLDFLALKTVLTEYGLVPVGIRGGNTLQQQAASTADFALLNTSSTTAKNAVISSTASKTKLTENKLKYKTKYIDHPVRSGQQIYAKDSDLIILASVSPGAEILAAGNIHIYGTLRGRALAGVNGDKTARIFCRKLEAELVSIAGHYWLRDDINAPPAGQIIQIYLENDHLQTGSF